MTLPELLRLAEPGTDAGTCYICGRTTETGWRGGPSDSFTAWAGCYAGEVTCEGCHALLKDARYRRYTWLATPGELRIADAGRRGWVWPTVCDPPEPPFAMYLTTGGQKQGWISLVNYVSESRESYYIGTDWTERPVPMQWAWVADHAEVVTALRALKVPRGVVAGSEVWSVSHLRRVTDAGLREHYDTARRLAGDPRWEVMVYAHG